MLKIARFASQTLFITASLGMTTLLSPSSFASEKSKLFHDASTALGNANASQANILAPKGYSQGSEHYQEAEVLYAKKRATAKVQKQLALARKHLSQAAKNAELARLTFAATLEARNDAKGVDAQRLASKEWKNAEEVLIRAANRMEVGNLKSAKKMAAEAEGTFRSAELIAIKASYLDEARQLIKQANKEKVNRYAPKTLLAAKTFLEQAEKELTNNRYDIDYPRSLAKKARYEAKHALYLAKRVKELDSGKLSTEEFLLSMEQPLIDIASTLDIVATFDNGHEIVTEELVTHIENLRSDAYELGERTKELAYLESEMSSLEKRMGVQSQRLAEQERQKEQLRQVSDLFPRDEAVVMTEGRNILIRVVGLTFDPGSAQINTSNFALLKKLTEAIDLYREYSVLIEGHTDAFGSDSVNLNLSFSRAESVKGYLDANMDAGKSVEAVGYGETRPIANNETREGRARNRRIDLVLRPPL